MAWISLPGEAFACRGLCGVTMKVKGMSRRWQRGGRANALVEVPQGTLMLRQATGLLVPGPVLMA